MDWHEAATGTLIAETSFVRLRVFGGDGRYFARVETLKGAGLCVRSDLPTSDAARAWCEAEYKKLLAAELARFS